MHKALAIGKSDTVQANKRSDGTYTSITHFPETIREEQCQPVIEHMPHRLDWIVI